MYTIDESDRIRELTDLPQQCTGAPMPIILATENGLGLAFWLAGDDDAFAVIEFDRVLAHYFGGPNDEALRGHPLYERGLGHYGVYEVLASSWLRTMERMNRVHGSHNPSTFEGYRHFIFSFKETPFECLAKGISGVQIFDDTNHDMLDEMVKQLRKER